MAIFIDFTSRCTQTRFPFPISPGKQVALGRCDSGSNRDGTRPRRHRSCMPAPIPTPTATPAIDTAVDRCTHPTLTSSGLLLVLQIEEFAPEIRMRALSFACLLVLRCARPPTHDCCNTTTQLISTRRSPLLSLDKAWSRKHVAWHTPSSFLCLSLSRAAPSCCSRPRRLFSAMAFLARQPIPILQAAGLAMACTVLPFAATLPT
ncbi:hypothetical protein QBC39DRAFT_344644 [Podospora conica]|nr:hypothetical protein QBC39DRAFT_344644 [Schizothecium conicum]